MSWMADSIWEDAEEEAKVIVKCFIENWVSSQCPRCSVNGFCLRLERKYEEYKKRASVEERNSLGRMGEEA